MRIALLMAGLFFALAAFRTNFNPLENTVLQGKITDDKGEALIGASVKILRGTDLLRGMVTDYNGEFRTTLDPGTYDIEVVYTGYQNSRTVGVQVLAGQVNYFNATLSESQALQEVVVTEYKVPLIELDKTSGGETISISNSSVWGASNPGSGHGGRLESTKKAARKPNGANTGKTITSQQTRSVHRTGAKVKGSRSNSALPPPNTPPAVKDEEDEMLKQVEKGNVALPLRDTSQPDYTAEQYNTILENPFLEATTNPLSTFSIDVDVASYANLRRYINAGQLPPADAVRIEEMVNYFDYQYDAPKNGDPFAVHTELAACPWQPRHQLLLVNLQGQTMDVGQLPASNLVFLVDVSGSMSEPDKLPLVVASLELLTDQLRPQDRVAVVVYAGAAGVVLPSTTGDQKAAIKKALNELSAGGSTAGGAGIQLAYKIAKDNFIGNGNNRVILCTDGDFNVGTSSEDDLVKLIEQQRETGIFLTVLGFGTGNYQDGKMQSLADKGNGNHAYIDQIEEAKKVLVREFGGTLFAIAKDVKLQLEFNPAQVAGYRLIGYENRLLAKEDFNDDTKDAGELGSGHRVTALYEIIPVGEPLPNAAPVDPLKYQLSPLSNPAFATNNDLLTIKFRYKPPRGNQPSRLLETVVPATLNATPSDNFLLATSVAEFGLLLRGSKYKGNATWPQLSQRANQAAQHDKTGYRKEFAELVEKGWRLAEPATAKK